MSVPLPRLGIFCPFQKVLPSLPVWVIDPLWFRVIPRSSKKVKTLPLSNLFQAKYHFHFCFYRRGLSFLAHKVSCHTKVPVSVSFWCFESQRSLIDKQGELQWMFWLRKKLSMCTAIQNNDITNIVNKTSWTEMLIRRWWTSRLLWFRFKCKPIFDFSCLFF